MWKLHISFQTNSVFWTPIFHAFSWYLHILGTAWSNYRFLLETSDYYFVYGESIFIIHVAINRIFQAHIRVNIKKSNIKIPVSIFFYLRPFSWRKKSFYSYYFGIRFYFLCISKIQKYTGFANYWSVAAIKMLLSIQVYPVEWRSTN